MDICLDDRVCLHIDGISAAVGLDAQRKVCVGINVPVKSAEEPKAAILVAERGVAWLRILVYFYI